MQNPSNAASPGFRIQSHGTNYRTAFLLPGVLPPRLFPICGRKASLYKGCPYTVPPASQGIPAFHPYQNRQSKRQNPGGRWQHQQVHCSVCQPCCYLRSRCTVICATFKWHFLATGVRIRSGYQRVEILILSFFGEYKATAADRHGVASDARS